MWKVRRVEAFDRIEKRFFKTLFFEYQFLKTGSEEDCLKNVFYRAFFASLFIMFSVAIERKSRRMAARLKSDAAND